MNNVIDIRPTYETPGDLDNERYIAQYVGAKWRCEFRKLPRKYFIDFGLVRAGAVHAFAEVKCRTNARAKYPTYLIALDKLLHALQLRQATGLPVFLIVRWSDRIGYVDMMDVSNANPKILWGGRTDRNDKQDLEPCVHIPIELFAGL